MINLVKIKDREEGNLKAHDILKKIVDKQTLLALSGGRSPDYRKMIVTEADIEPGAVCVVDERFGEPYHPDSNEFLIKDFGVEAYLKTKGIEYHKILTSATLEDTAVIYNQVIGELFSKYPKRVGVMGFGQDLHTAGIFPGGNSIKSSDWVCCESFDLRYPKRITLTIKALNEFSNFIILVFDKTKKEAVSRLMSDNASSVEDYPAIFYREAPVKCYLITDIAV